MQTENRLLDDLARVASGAINTFATVRDEIETRVRERVDRLVADLDLVTREEFEAARAMASKARSEQEQLLGRIEALEKRIAALEVKKAPSRATRKATGGSTRARTSAAGSTRSTRKAAPEKG